MVYILPLFLKYRLELDLLSQADTDTAKSPRYMSHGVSMMQPPQTAAGKSKTISRQINLRIPWLATQLAHAAHALLMGFI